jgi:CheY-like chemotaxis protein
LNGEILPIRNYEHRDSDLAQPKSSAFSPFECYKAKLMIKILLVEDSKFLRVATERALARAGYKVSCAIDGEEVLRVAREKIPDLILLDMMLPKMSGPDVLMALKKDPLTQPIPVVVMTAMSQRNAARLQAAGAFGFLEKSALELEKGSQKLLSALADIIKTLPLSREQTTSSSSP